MLGMAEEGQALPGTHLPAGGDLQTGTARGGPALMPLPAGDLLPADGREPQHDCFFSEYHSANLPPCPPPEAPREPSPAGRGGPPQPGQCAGCGDRIADRYYLLAVEKPWHIHCLLCSECRRPLDSHVTCFARDGSIYCKEDYYRRFAVKQCARCHMTISSHELVMRARDFVYHLNCFTCATCHKMLTPGEHFGMREEVIFCRLHYEELVSGHLLQDVTGSGGYPRGPHVRMYNGVGGAQKGRPRKRKQPMSEMDLCPNPMGRMGLDGDFCSDLDLPGVQNGGHGGYGSSKHKRMRTSFKHNQLRTMRSYFSLNHNPDAKDLKDLSQKTGLSKKVLQVWFQNARAKYRRNVLKHDQAEIKDEQNNNTENQDSSKNFTSSRSPGAVSDISSSASLTDIQGLTLDPDKSTSGSSCLSDLCHGRHNSM